MFILIHLMLQKMKNYKQSSVINLVEETVKLRKMRPQLIASPEQYLFCYEAIETYAREVLNLKTSSKNSIIEDKLK